MIFRWLALISFCIFLTQNLSAQPADAPPEVPLETVQPLAEPPSLEEQRSERTLYENRLQVANAAIAHLEKTQTQITTAGRFAASCNAPC